MARSWRSAISEVEAANLGENQHVKGRAREEAEPACTYRYCGLAVKNAAGGSGDNHTRVHARCPNGGFVHVSCMLGPADRLARGHIDPRFCVACSCEWVGGRRPPHPAMLARGLPMTQSGGRWAALRNTMQFADFLQRDGPGPASYLTTGVHKSFELMIRA